MLRLSKSRCGGARRNSIGSPRGVFGLVREFSRAREGNIAILFAVMAGVLMLFVGGAVDYTRRNAIQTELIESLDSAGLAIAQLDALNGPEIRDLSSSERLAYLKDYGHDFFDSNFKSADYVENLSVDFDIDDQKITPRATGTIKAIFLPFGQVAVSGTTSVAAGSLSVDTSTEVTRASVGDTEVALVLDTTGSMSGSKISDLKNAAKELVDILVREDQTDYYSKVAIAPFSLGVNAGSFAAAARGDIAAPKSVTGADWKDGSPVAISDATWKSGSPQNITGATRTSPVRVTTSASHGFANGDRVFVAGVSGMWQINNRIFTVAGAGSSAFDLSGENGGGHNSYSSSTNDFATKCETSACEIVITTSSAHGLETDDYAYVAGAGGMTQINGNVYRVRKIDNTSVALAGVVGTSFGDYSSGGTITKCKVDNCNVVVSSTGHGFATNDRVYVASVNGMTQINNSMTTSTASSPSNFWSVTRIDANTFSLNGSVGPNYSTYSSGGDVYCTTLGCEYQYFTNQNGNARVFRISNCVSERTGTDKFTDASASTAPLGHVYLESGASCGLQPLTPLTADSETLEDAIDALNPTGPTAGHIGIGWGWYLVSPNFSGMFTGEAAPAAYTDDEVIKAVVVMTDGEFNMEYCSGVLSQSSSNGSSSDKINCNAPNGSSFTQAAQLCTAMKAAGIKVYTVGFQLGGQVSAANFMANCATDASHAYTADDGDELKEAFKKIAQDIRRLRISR
jgi:Flp pilus assembly protein TadG